MSSFNLIWLSAIGVFITTAGVVTFASKGQFRKRFAVALIAVASLAMLATGLWGLGIPFIAFIVGAFAGLPALILGVVTAVLKKKRAATFFLSLATLILCAFIVSTEFGRWELSAALNYCESLAAEIQAYKRQHGSYPDNLSLINTSSGIVPLRLLFHGANTICGYKAIGGRTFSFRIYSSGSFPSYWEYPNGIWSHVD